MLRFITLLLLFFIFSTQSVDAQHYIDTNTNFIRGNVNIFTTPGDTIYVLAGQRPYLLFEDIHGSPDSIIVIINSGGVVEINTNHYFGLSTHNCTYFKITGTGDQNHPYGINISKVANGGGIGLSKLSNHFEVDHIRVANTLTAGIYAKSDPDTSFISVRDSFLMEDVFIHNNLIENTGDEGMYIGSTKYFGQIINYNGKDTLVYPHLLKNVSISNNQLVNTGWDGIQLSSATYNSKINNNLIIRDSQRKTFNQMSGIILGGGTQADCFNNFIADGNGSGIVVASIGGQRIFNNIILNPGINYHPGNITQMQHGIYVGDISTFSDSSFYILNNFIYNPKTDGIRFTSLLSNKNLIANNIIVNPGAYHYYDSLHTRFKANDAFVMISDTNIVVDTLNNYNCLHLAGLFMTDTFNYDFSYLSNSPLIDSGICVDSLGISIDFYNHPRGVGIGCDIGPFEYNALYEGINDKKKPEASEIVYPNPAKDLVHIKLPEDECLKEIILMDNSGRILKKIKEEIWVEKIVEVNLNGLVSGLYFLEIVTSNKKYIKKLIKVN